MTIIDYAALVFLVEGRWIGMFHQRPFCEDEVLRRLSKFTTPLATMPHLNEVIIFADKSTPQHRIPSANSYNRRS